jgi:hypothetical protein
MHTSFSFYFFSRAHNHSARKREKASIIWNNCSYHYHARILIINILQELCVREKDDDCLLLIIHNNENSLFALLSLSALFIAILDLNLVHHGSRSLALYHSQLFFCIRTMTTVTPPPSSERTMMCDIKRFFFMSHSFHIRLIKVLRSFLNVTQWYASFLIITDNFLLSTLLHIN